MALVFSGIQPTGNLHLGNYLGSINQWLSLQGSYNCIFSIVDLHALTIDQNPKHLEDNILLTLATYIASGIDYSKNIVFQQSKALFHLELYWIFASLVKIGHLNRMTQFKDKASLQGKDNATLGLLSYPVLMAADILLYGTNLVPVGEDQKQHLELTRDIVQMFNQRYEVDFFELPEVLITKSCKRVMSLKDGTKKMSKSDPNDMSRINLFDSEEIIIKKIQKCKTDSIRSIGENIQNRPEIYNLLEIYSTLSQKSIEDILPEVQDLDSKSFKDILSSKLVSFLLPISQKIEELMRDKAYLRDILNAGNNKAKEIATERMSQIKKIVGIY